MKVPEVTAEMFFKVGMWCFLVIGVFSGYNFIINLPLMNIPGIISTGSSIFFNFVTAAFFYTLLRNTGGTSSVSSVTKEELQELVSDFGNKE